MDKVFAVEQSTDNLNIHCENTLSTFSFITTFAGGSGIKSRMPGSVKLNTPMGVFFNTNDNFLYVCDSHKHVVRKISLKGRTETFVKDIIYVSYIAINYAENSMYILQLYKNVVTKISATGEVKTFAKIGKAGINPVFCYPSGLAIDQQTGNLFFSEFWSHTIHKITPQGEVSLLAGRSGESGFADGTKEEAKFNLPGGLWFDQRSSTLLVCDCNNDRVRRISMKGDVEVSTVCRVKDPACIVATASGTMLVGTQTCIYKLTELISGAFEASLLCGDGGKGKTEVGFGQPLGIAVHEASHTCFVSKSGSNTIRKISFINGV